MFAKLFASITESSLWSEPKEVRLLFVSMLARADQSGFVEAAIPGLARLANLTVDETESALQCLMAPDKYSKNADFEGRRIAPVEGGYLLLNYEAYRSKRDEEQRREYMRQYMAEYRRSGKQPVNICKQSKPDVSHSKPPLAQAEAEADKRKKGAARPRTQPQQPADTSEIAIPPKANTAKVIAAVERWKQHLDAIAVGHSLHYDNSPQLEAMFMQAARMGEKRFVESIDWNILNGRHTFAEKWDGPHARGGSKRSDGGADAVWLHVCHVLTSTDDTPSGRAERDRLLTPAQREAVKRCRTRTRLDNAKSELDRKQIGEEFLQMLQAVEFEAKKASEDIGLGAF